MSLVTLTGEQETRRHVDKIYFSAYHDGVGADYEYSYSDSFGAEMYKSVTFSQITLRIKVKLNHALSGSNSLYEFAWYSGGLKVNGTPLIADTGYLDF